MGAIMRQTRALAAGAFAAAAVGLGLFSCTHRVQVNPPITPAISLEVREVHLADKQDPYYLFEAVSRDQMHVAVIRKHQGGQLVEVDGVPGKTYDKIEGFPEFSPDGKRVAYVVRRGEKQLVVIDGVDGPEFDWTAAGRMSINFSPDSRRVVYSGSRADQWFVVIDGVEHGPYDEAPWYSLGPFSPDSNHVWYVLPRSGKEVVVVDGRERKPYDAVSDPTFSPDSRHLAYAAMRRDRWFVVRDGVEGKGYSAVQHLAFSPDSEHIAYVATEAERWPFFVEGIVRRFYATERVVVDDVEHRAFEDVLLTHFPQPKPHTDAGAHAYMEYKPFFTPVRTRVLYVGRRNGEERLVVDGVEHERADSVGHGYPYFPGFRPHVRVSPDGRQLAYVWKTGERESLVVGGTVVGTCDVIADFAFSPDSRRLAYAGRDGGTARVVLDGKVFAEHVLPDCESTQESFSDAHGVGGLTFSPDSRRLAYTVRSAEGEALVVDGVPGTVYSDVYSPQFTADSRHVAYIARLEKGICFVVDGVESGHCDSLAASPYELVFDSPRAFHVMAFKKGAFVRLHFRIVEKEGPSAPVGGQTSGGNTP